MSHSATADIVASAELFDVPGPGPYVMTHSIGCLPKAAVTALNEGFFRPWRARGADAWPDWLRAIDDFRSLLASLFGGSQDEYCPQTNLSSALTKVLSALPVTATGRRVLLAAEDAFPSLGYVLQRQAKRGYETRLIPRERSPALLETWSRELSSEVAAVLVTHVHSNTGVVSPVAEISRLCREREIFCIADVAQSAGILPCSFQELGAQVVLGSCVKWLCGGSGAGFVWIEPSTIPTLEPLDVGWFSHADPFEMDIRSFEYAPDARRFWGGTPSIAPFVIATAGLRVIRQIGVTGILAHNRRLMQEFKDHLAPAWRGRLPTDAVGGTLCIPTGGEFERIRDALTSAHVRFDTRKDVIRISFHVCNSREHAAAIAQAWNSGT